MPPSSRIIPFVTWGRSRQAAGGKSKWHLLVDLRRYTGQTTHRGRWSKVAPGALFAATACGQALTEPEYGPLTNPKRIDWLRPGGLVVPGSGDACLPCAEVLARELDSVPI
jgi:hypothetical protein